MSELLAMGNYGAYVWSSFGLTLLVVVICIVQGKRRHSAILRDVKMRIRALETET